MNSGEFIWVQPMRSDPTLRPAVVLGVAKISAAMLNRFGLSASTTIAWRVILLDTLYATGEVQIFEAAASQIKRRMSPLEALAYTAAGKMLNTNRHQSGFLPGPSD